MHSPYGKANEETKKHPSLDGRLIKMWGKKGLYVYPFRSISRNTYYLQTFTRIIISSPRFNLKRSKVHSMITQSPI